MVDAHTPHRERRPRVVLADDHPSVLAAFARLLNSCCEVVASVSNGREAVEAVSTLSPDVLVVDLMMPDVDGLEVCRIVKQMMPRIGVVIVTAFDDPYVSTAAIHAGAAAFVPKHSASSTLGRTILRLFCENQRATTGEPA